METNILTQLASLVLPSEILERFEIVKIETDEQDIDAMSMTIHLDERMNERYQANEVYESLGFMDAVSVTDFPIRDHKVVLKLRRRRWKDKRTGESFVEHISVTEKGTRYSKEFAAFLKETYGDIPGDLPYA
jgi:transposase